MLHYLKGKLIEKSPVHAVIECSGVAYFLNVSLYTYSALPDSGDAQLFTHFHINGNDFSLILYGFINEDERDIFRKLISVSGVGHNTARMVLSSIGAGEVKKVIMQKDVASLKRIKGIGEKTAERIIVDLHDKIYKGNESAAEKISVSHNTLKLEALAALSSLGLEKTKTEKLLDKMLLQDSTLTLEEVIRQVLKQI
ncbi:MAG: Holliday junction branch migration protein RuvA [Crocinitomicaceae bacterium]|nr:Holliday junction branch migration protein RuvA [Crocinitomicaceae bacterium]